MLPPSPLLRVATALPFGGCAGGVRSRMTRLVPSTLLLTALASAGTAHAQDGAQASFLSGAKLWDKHGKEVPVDSLKGSSVALYFAGMWCPMCTSFTPQLKTFFAQNAVCSDTGVQKAQIIFVSSDWDKNEAQRHFTSSHGDWLMLDYDSPLRDDLKRRYQVWGGAEMEVARRATSIRRAGIPGMVVVDATGKELAFLATESRGAAALESWKLDEHLF